MPTCITDIVIRRQAEKLRKTKFRFRPHYARANERRGRKALAALRVAVRVVVECGLRCRLANPIVGYDNGYDLDLAATGIVLKARRVLWQSQRCLVLGVV